MELFLTLFLLLSSIAKVIVVASLLNKKQLIAYPVIFKQSEIWDHKKKHFFQSLCTCNVIIKKEKKKGKAFDQVLFNVFLVF